MTTTITRQMPHGSRILGIGSYRPARQVPNSEIGRLCGVSTDWIESRTGVVSRRFASPEDTLTTMATAAGRDACAHAGIAPDEIDCVILTTTSDLTQVPPRAPEVSYLIGTHRAPAYDLSCACPGFCYALGTASYHIRSGTARHALIIATERMSDITNLTDPNTAPLCADGAAAVVIGASPTTGISPMVWGSDGSHTDAVRMTCSWGQFLADPALASPTLTMNGAQVWRWVRHDVVAGIQRIVKTAGADLADVRVFIPHQANGRIIDMLVERLTLPADTVVARDIVHSGNTSSASVPLAMAHVLAQGRAASGDLALLVGFGAGLSFAGQMVTLP
ncbi:ketoacyl-ACP synthase III [Streptomyces pathocidini]|uniref:ketoacyl-ACP synthase III n=1 Tax=Streptomyces pathocidini TaxID=1650571 RepID=UPI0033F11F29